MGRRKALIAKTPQIAPADGRTKDGCDQRPYLEPGYSAATFFTSAALKRRNSTAATAAPTSGART